MDFSSRLLRLTLILILLATPICAGVQLISIQSGDDTYIDNLDEFDNSEVFLIISSFNPDTKRVSDFISDMDAEIKKHFKNRYRILIEDISAKNFSEEAHIWKDRVAKILNKYKNRNIKAVIAIGQEAWSALSSQEKLSHNYPYMCSFISSNGIDLPEEPINNEWEAEWVNIVRKMRQKCTAGGVFNQYNVQKNIELALNFYPETKTIALLTDNTYGGASIKALFKRNIKDNPISIKYVFVDSRTQSFNNIKETIDSLPSNSILMIGTWKVNRHGLYYMDNSLQELLSDKPGLPVFSISGTGIGLGAIGGYNPTYHIDASIIVNQIKCFYEGKRDSVRFISTGTRYQFDHNTLDKLNLTKNMLPDNSLIVNHIDPRVQKYRFYLLVAIMVTLALTLIIITFLFLHIRNLRLKKALVENSHLLVKAKEQAEESDRLKSAFIANMSHEIRTPLNAIVGFSNLMCEEDYSEIEKKEMGTIISKNSTMLLTLISDIMDFSRLEADKLIFTFKKIDLNVLCEHTIATISQPFKPNVEFIFEPGEKELVLKTDPNRLTQVLYNLLSNSGKFTEKGTVALKYEVYPTEDKILKIDKTGYTNNYILFSITDTGPGINDEHQKLLFQRFGKFNSNKQGIGLGLAISKQIIARLGGEIWLDCDYKEGARFYFTHPL